MTISTRSSLLGLLLALATLTDLLPAAASTPAEAAGVEARLERITRVLRQGMPSIAPPEEGEELLARGFLNGPYRGFGNGRYGSVHRGPVRTFANGHRYYGPRRSFLNGGGGYYGGGFVNGRPYRRGFINW